MQCYPTSATPNGGQTYPCNPSPGPRPQLLGEGGVAWLSLPDGSAQLCFVPWPAPAAACCPCPPQNFPTWNNPEAWFIRSVSNQFPAQQPVPNQQFQTPASPSWAQNNNDYYGNKPGYQLKFHNDNWTSTTDLHYFSPPLRNWFPKQCAGSQTEPLDALAQPRPWPSSPCACACYKQNESRKRQEDLSDCKSSCSSMSVELGKEGIPTTSSRVKKKKKKAWPLRKIQISEKASIKCECDLQPETRKSDKAVTTYAEKMVGGGADNGRATQTTCGPSTPIRRVDSFFRVNDCETAMWYPRTPLSRHSMECSECGEDARAGGGATSAGASDSDAAPRY